MLNFKNPDAPSINAYIIVPPTTVWHNEKKTTMYKEKKEKKVSHISKVIILLTLGFGFKLFSGCTPSSQSPIAISYNNISIVAVDNSGRFMASYNRLYPVYSDAVALKLTLSDTSMFYAASYSPNIMQAFSFQTVQANSINPSYIPLNKVVGIKVKTLLDINEFIKAGDDISEHILCSTRNDFDMYSNLSQGISLLNGVQDNVNSSIGLVLKTSVQNTNAQFEVVVTLDSGDDLLCITEVFTIIKS